MPVSIDHYETREIRAERNLDGSIRELVPVLGSERQGIVLVSPKGKLDIPLNAEQFAQYMSLHAP